MSAPAAGEKFRLTPAGLQALVAKPSTGKMQDGTGKAAAIRQPCAVADYRARSILRLETAKSIGKPQVLCAKAKSAPASYPAGAVTG
ncbi:hypothetical protein AB838_01545 [Rhodobacteraceae bacterium (ex Bugula neritina AB1)]|nr:hypothetical protein AB838_01545 [Rhodobacteraceae bacterium (ex Bugula neritina AB1)]